LNSPAIAEEDLPAPQTVEAVAPVTLDLDGLRSAARALFDQLAQLNQPWAGCDGGNALFLGLLVVLAVSVELARRPQRTPVPAPFALAGEES
jgi:hypothetical protein